MCHPELQAREKTDWMSETTRCLLCGGRCDDVDLVVVSYNGTPRPFAKYCGSRVPPITMSTDNTAEVLLFTRQSSSSSSTSYWVPDHVGFRAEFAFVSGKNSRTKDDTAFVCSC